jgi:general secretion pathway protein I
LFRATIRKPRQARRTAAGFTLIEVLVALCIVATLFSSLTALVVTAARGNRSIDERLAKFETARAILAALPDHEQLVSRTLSGETNGYHWRVDESPLIVPAFTPPADTPWIAQTVSITVGSSSGGPIRLDTVRLHRRTVE